jgi:hypothetical protein
MKLGVNLLETNSDKKIFIALIAYNEPDINQTIYNCLENAKYPERISFGIWNHFNNEKIIIDKFPNCKIVNVEYNSLLGVGLPRLNVLSLYNNEDYILQIDAHMLFDKDWDTNIIFRFLNIKEFYLNPVITGYIGWWSRLDDGTITNYSPVNSYKSGKMIITKELIGNNPHQILAGVNWNNKLFEEHYGFSAHFVFTEPKFFQEILPDPKIMFAGEETTTALRGWTRGYKFFVIPESVVWHRNKGTGILYKYDRFNYLGNPDLSAHYFKKVAQSEKRVQDILTGNILGYWGAKSLESLEEYENAIGINFKDLYND